MRGKHLFRVRLIFAFFFIVFILFIARLYELQIINGASYREKIDNRYLKNDEVFNRNSIFWSDKKNEVLSAATIEETYNLTINPTLVKDPKLYAEKIASVIDINKNTFIEQAKKENDSYELIKANLSKEDIDKIQTFSLSGVFFEKKNNRLYPAKTMGARMLGFVGYEGDRLVGRYGLERYYEDTLFKTETNLYSNFLKDITSDMKDIFTRQKKISGDIVLSVEASVERELENQLALIQERWHSKLSGGIIIDPNTGDIIAMSVLPSYDPNNYALEKDSSVFSNPLVEGVYELGSIVKPLTMAVGLDLGLVSANTTYEDIGSLQIEDRVISNFDKRARGIVNMQDVLNQSLNLGATFVANKVGKKKMSEYFESFGLGEETGIDLPTEARGNITNLLKGGQVELATASFGQGIALSPIGAVRALSALANGGLLINPHIVKEIKYQMGVSKKISTNNEENKRVIKESTSKEISRMLKEAFENGLLGGKYKLEKYSISAKTGTAQIAKKDSRGYYEDRFLHSFFGYFPSNAPRFLVFLYTIEPQGVSYASNTLPEPFINIVKFLINYYQILPDR